MKSLLMVLLLIVIATSTTADWSWNEAEDDQQPSESENVQTNITNVDKVVDEILVSQRQGRALQGYDEVYSDPTVQDALQKGDDGEARNLIKDRLCHLGLMQCDVEIEGKRPYIAPEELIYAQPVAINPVGRPIPTIPIKGNRGNYGSPKPVPFPGKYPGFKPPRRQYGPPTLSAGVGLKPPPFLSAGEILAEGEFLDKPPSLDYLTNKSPYQFESVGPTKDKRVEITVNAQGGGSAVTGPPNKVEHVHHHYHHNADGTVGQTPAVSAAAVATDLTGFIPLSTGNLPLSTNNYVGHNTFQTKPVSETYLTSGLGSFGTNNNYYGTNGFYKKELHVDSGTNYLGTSDKYVGVESARAENYDCVCVPYEQCPTHDVIGRKDDLYLALDPRNLKTDIQAEDGTETRVITDGNGTMTVVNVPKEAEEVKQLSKRDVTTEKLPDDHKIEGRQYQNQYNDIMKKLKPTFGISVGLPYQGGGYPFSPHSIYPNHGTIDGHGINLGLVSINPLVSVQFSKDDYGNKVIKPFVNLHVTPNNYLVNKFEDLLSYKKGVINKHKHYHLHKPAEVYYHRPNPVIYQDDTEFLHHGPELSHHSPEPSHYSPELSHYGSKPFNYGHKLSQYSPELSHYGSKPFNYGHELSQYSPEYPYYPESSYGRSLDNVTLIKDVSPLDQYQVRVGKSLRGEEGKVAFPSSRRRRRDILTSDKYFQKRQAYYGRPQSCGPRHVCCRKPSYTHQQPQINVNRPTCGTRHSQGINGRIKNPVYVDGDSEFGEYPWQVAILKKDPKESVYVCGGTLIDPLHIITAAHCVKQYTNFDLRVRLGEWDVNHDVEFYPYIERDISSLTVHPEFYAGTLANDIAILRMSTPVDFTKYPHISSACLPHPQDDYTGTRCWTTGWGKDAFGDFGKYQNILKEVEVPVVESGLCQRQLQNTRLGYEFRLHPGFVCAGGEAGKDACKGDGGGPMVCERGGTWQVVGVVSWGIGCGESGVPGVYVKVAHYLDWIRQLTQRY